MLILNEIFIFCLFCGVFVLLSAEIWKKNDLLGCFAGWLGGCDEKFFDFVDAVFHAVVIFFE